MVFTANSTLEPAALSESKVQITENSQNFREIDALIVENVVEEITVPLFEVKNCCEARGQETKCSISKASGGGIAGT